MESIPLEALNQALKTDLISVKKLSGYNNCNYLVTADKTKYIFKSYLYTAASYINAQAENEVLQYLKGRLSITIPQPLPFEDGMLLYKYSVSEKAYFGRLLTFVEGEFLGDGPTTMTQATSLGAKLAELNTVLGDYSNYIIECRHWEWNLAHVHLNKKYLKYITNPHRLKIAQYFFDQIDANLTPIQEQLRKAITYHDANEWNILIQGDTVTGMIDFGDLAYGPLVNELAIACVYAGYREGDYLAKTLAMVESYNQVLPLQVIELDALYYCIAGRLLTSVCNAAYARVVDPENTYAGISEDHAWTMLSYWLTLNPSFLQNKLRELCDFEATPVPTMESLLNTRFSYFGKTLSVSYNNPIYFTRAAFQYMYDGYGHTFLDAYNNIPCVGHCHPHVTALATAQIKKLNTNTRYIYEPLHQYADMLLKKFDPSLQKLYLVNSGSAASDLAIRIALALHQNQGHIVVVEHGYHGNTNIGIDISHYKFNQKKGFGQKPYIIKASIPDTYRGKYQGPSAGQQYALDLIQQLEQVEGPIAAFIAEPIVGCGGQVPLASGYLPKVYQYIRKRGGLCISDEVQTGFGRLGSHFWGYQMYDVIPDIVILGKPMGNGHPIGGVVTTQEVADRFDHGVEFFSSFGGNPVSCEIGRAVLEIIDSEELQNNAHEVGQYYIHLLQTLGQKHDCIGDIRGSGLFLGVDIVVPGTTDPNTTLASKLRNDMRQRHILLSTDGPADNVLKTKPPMCFTKQNAETVVSQLDDILSGL